MTTLAKVFRLASTPNRRRPVRGYIERAQRQIDRALEVFEEHGKGNTVAAFSDHVVNNEADPNDPGWSNR
jgi:hypothetical protein